MAYILKVNAADGGVGDVLTFSSLPMFGGNEIAHGDTVFIWTAETAGGSGLVFDASVKRVEQKGRRIKIDVRLERRTVSPLGVSELAPYRDSEDFSAIAGLARKLYRHSHNKLAALTHDEAKFLARYFLSNSNAADAEVLTYGKPEARAKRRRALSLPLLLIFACALVMTLWMLFSPGPDWKTQSIQYASGSIPATMTKSEAYSLNKATVPVTSGAREKKESVQAVRGAAVETITLDALTDAHMIEATRSDIVGDGYDCISVTAFWNVRGFSGTAANVFKVDCGVNGNYQITMLNGREFIKPWTGVMLGD